MQDTLREIAATIWSYPGVQFITVGVILNLALALAQAVKNNVFTFREVGAFLYSQLLPYTIVYGVAAAVTDGTDYQWIPAVVLGAITAMMGARILDNLSQLGIPIPEGVLSLAREPKQFLIVHKIKGSDVE
jgi:hypothetical protein